ncbi:LysM peptidoglycan-binding domain-containing protein, partial [Hoeflea sp.]|uniref:LysM peptidoglycan-binding domain-containing protein n=1 Tax=Hoeflea sp. TaxID=1940281 RepID=UPI0019896348
PGWAAGSYTVRNGDTLQSIARAIWGDAAMWYLLADANGLTGSEALTADTVLTLPNKVTNIHNNSTTFRPYNPAEAMGDVNPTLPDAPPPPRKKKKCGGLGGIIVAVVTIAVAVIAPQYLPAMTPVLKAATVAAIANVAGQITGNIVGVQSGFNFRGFATDVLSAGITHGLLGNTPLGELVGDSVMGAAALSSVVRQGVANVTGEQRGFSWAAVAGSAVGAWAGAKIGGALAGSLADKAGNLTKAADLVTRGVQGVVTGVASQLTRIAIEGGKLNWSAVAADGLGAVAGGVVGRLSSAAQSGTQAANPNRDIDWIAGAEKQLDPARAVLLAANGNSREDLDEVIGPRASNAANPSFGVQYPDDLELKGPQTNGYRTSATRNAEGAWELEPVSVTAQFDADDLAFQISSYAAGERVRALMDGGRMLWPTLDALDRAPRLTSQQLAAEQRFSSSVGPINQSTNHAREYRRQQTLSRIGFAQSWPFSHVAALTTRAFGFSHEESIALGAEIGGTMMLSAPSNGLGPSRPVHRAPIQTLKGLSAPGEVPVVRPPSVRVDVTNSAEKFVPRVDLTSLFKVKPYKNGSFDLNYRYPNSHGLAASVGRDKTISMDGILG